MKNKIKNITILFDDYSSSNSLFEETKKAVKELKLSFPIEQVNDRKKMSKLGLNSGPALLINEIPVLVGDFYKKEDIKSALGFFMKEKSCGGSCHSCSYC